jgi:hypothetical protein
LTAAVQRRFIQELRSYWATHPRYPDLIDNIQGKYSFEQRPQYGIIVKVGSANKVQLSANNFVGTVQSYVALARIPGYPGTSCEWVREDSLAIQANGGRFPVPAGIYYCEMTEDDQFYVDPLLEVRNERLTMSTASEGVLQQVPYEKSLRLIEVPGGRLYVEGTDYTIGGDGVTVYLRTPLPNGVALRAEYRYAGETTGPWEAKALYGYNKAIPGCVLVFGRRAKKGDRFAVVVGDTREDAYQEYGGRWDLTLDIDIVARDVYAQREIADLTTMFLWTVLRPSVIDEGIDVTEISMGGESEEVFDENADDYFYNSSISMTVQTDWFSFVPIIPRILTVAQTVTGLPQGLQIDAVRDPFFGGRFTTFESIS